MIPQRVWRHARAAAALAALWLATSGSPAYAEDDERGVEVRVGVELAPRELIAGLNAGLRAWNVRVTEQWVEPSCAPIVGRTEIRASVSLNWQAGGPVVVCFSTQLRSFQRELGPFDALHARAREELVTIVEAGLEALMEPDAVEAEAMPGAATLPNDSADTAWRFPKVPPPRITWPLAEPVSPQRAAWTLGIGYAPTLWGEDIVAQGVSAFATRSIDTHRLFHVGARVVYAPVVHVERDGAGLVARELQAQLMFALVAPLLSRLALEASLAPGLTWLAVDPELSPSRNIYDIQSKQHWSPLLTAQAGPRLAVASRIVLSAQIGCSAMLQEQRFGYRRDELFVPVLQMQPIRLSFELGARIGL